MHIEPKHVVRIFLSTVVVAALSACGGAGEGGPTISNITANNAVYGKTMTVVVTGNGLNRGITVSAEPGCGAMKVSSGATDDLQSFTCKVASVGSVQPRVRNADGREIGTVRLEVPMPQVTITATQGSNTGTIVLELDPVRAPATVDNFLTYVNQATPFHKNTLFHRAEAGVLIQAGGYTTGLAPKTTSIAPIVLESDNGLKNLRATVGMARLSEPNTATTQFYINLRDNPSFDRVDDANPGYAVFGTVVTGMEVADFIGATAVEAKAVKNSNPVVTLPNVPVSEIKITAISQTR